METVSQPSAGMLDMLIAHHKLIVARYSSPLKISLRSTFDMYVYIYIHPLVNCHITKENHNF